MAKNSSTQALTPSIFDRLLDYNPSSNTEGQVSRGQVIKELRESVRRDLEFLLNSRRPCISLPKKWQQLEDTVINYGIPDYTGVNLDVDDERVKFASLIERIILKNETRLKSVKITVIDESESMDRTFHFRIDGILKVEPAVKPVVFDSIMEPVSRTFEVKDVNSG